MKFDTRIHTIKLKNGINISQLQCKDMCNMCRVVNRTQHKIIWIYQIKFDMLSSSVWSDSMKNAVKFDGAGQLLS